MKYILLSFFLFSTLLSQGLGLDNLLKEYEDSESLYNKTKKESAGYLLVYSRKDLETMQAFSLRDVMKTVRMYTMQVNNVGVLKLPKTAQGKKAMPPIKLYIDDFEVTTALQANALDSYGDMDLYFVDHIEIYQGGSSIAFGNEPGSMVIRLYSKEPLRENSRSAQLSIDSKSGGNIRAIDAGSMGKYDYLIYANANKMNFDKYNHNQQELSRDTKKYQAHFKFSQKENFSVEIDGISNKTDIFSGFGHSPVEGRSIRDYGYINITKFFPNNFKIAASVSAEHDNFKNQDAQGFPVPGGSRYKDFDADIDANIYKIIAEKKILSGNNDFLVGVEFQQKNVSPNYYKDQGQDKHVVTGADKLDIYMFYLEELYNINKNHLLAFSGKVDHYKNNLSKSSTQYSVRLGYIALINEKWKTKLFAIRRYVYPTMIQTSFTPPVYAPNPKLETAKINMITGELEYDYDDNRAVFGYAHKVIDNGIMFNPTLKKYVNKTTQTNFDRIYLRTEHKFDFDNKVVVEYYRGYAESYSSPAAGVLVQAFNKLGRFDIYNELVYRDGYTIKSAINDVEIADGYDYTLSVSYPLSRDLKLKAKGENLLNKASKTLIDPQGSVKVPAIERRAIITMEYTF